MSDEERDTSGSSWRPGEWDPNSKNTETGCFVLILVVIALLIAFCSGPDSTRYPNPNPQPHCPGKPGTVCRVQPPRRRGSGSA